MNNFGRIYKSCKCLSKKYSRKYHKYVLCLFSLVTAAQAGVDVLKTKVRRISEVLFDGFLRTTSDIFPRLLVSVPLSCPPSKMLFSLHSFALGGVISANP